MIILIAGASHTGKTALAQKLLKKFSSPYLSIDHLKMGLIRSGQTALTAMSDEQALTGYLCPIVREMIKTAIENQQDLIVEGSYIPFNWAEEFGKTYLEQIKYVCLIMTEDYIKNHFSTIKSYANVVEKRIDDDWCTMDLLLRDNASNLKMVKQYGLDYILIEDDYEVDVEV